LLLLLLLVWQVASLRLIRDGRCFCLLPVIQPRC
jgi:hypothetical protein